MIKVFKFILGIAIAAFCTTWVVDWIGERKAAVQVKASDFVSQAENAVSGVREYFNPAAVKAKTEEQKITIDNSPDTKKTDNVAKVKKIVEPKKKVVDFSEIYKNLESADEIYSSFN